MYKHILIALEGKPSDEAAISHASFLARHTSAKITLLRVIPVAADDSGGFAKQFQIETGSSGWRRKNQAEEMLVKLGIRLRLNGLFVESALIVGDRSDADEIVSFSSKVGCDLIVMAADGRPWWQRALFGCPADGVHRKASVPTLFVSDGTRRARVAMRETIRTNAIMEAFGTPCL
jgi:nucleotide-binding universal stress UspA family protein